MANPSEPNLESWPIEGERPKFLPCRNCGSAAIAILDTPAGCVAFPDARRLEVCPQHLNNWGFIDGAVLVAEVEPGIAAWAGY